MSDIEKRARELLAAQYDRDGLHMCAADLRSGRLNAELGWVRDAERGARAIIAALTPPEGCALAVAARAGLPFIAYAFAQGVDGAEEAGRAIEAALETNEPETYVQVPVELLRIVIGCAYPVSTEIDPRGYRWSEAYLDEALPHVKAALLAARPAVSGG